MGTLISILKRFINSDLTKPINTMIDEVKATLTLIKAKTDTITADLFTATHASRLDDTISSRQANAGLTTTHAGRIDKAISSRRGVYHKVVSGQRYHVSAPIDASFVTLLNITNTGGILRSINAICTVSLTPNDFIVQITIDGIIQSFSTPSGVALQTNPTLYALSGVYQPLAIGETQGSNFIPIDLEFSTNCKVELKLTKAQSNGTSHIIATAHTE